MTPAEMLEKLVSRLTYHPLGNTVSVQVYKAVPKASAESLVELLLRALEKYINA